MPTPESLALLARLAHVYLVHDRPQKAAVLFDALAALGAAGPAQQVARALALLRAGQAEAALAALEQAAMAAAPDAAFQLVRAQALAALGREDEAAAAMRAYVATRAPAPSYPYANA
ncbi:hypothetical protein V8Z80_13025 [Orrella sp. JC864]|uniref:type III secretion apparatus assembly chaperone SctY n=1 Tax=Orrella sp. JC864 TaxID=3120298 RepID=UPI003008E901